MHYVYHLRSSLDNLVFYVGKGSTSRMFKHIEIALGNNEKLQKKNPHLYRKIAQIYRIGGEVICEKVFETNSEAESYVKESEDIEKLVSKISQTFYPVVKVEKTEREFLGQKKEKGNTLNLEEAKKIKPQSEEHRENLRKAATGKPGYWKGKNLSEETKERMRKAKKKSEKTESRL